MTNNYFISGNKPRWHITGDEVIISHHAGLLPDMK
jgi:hypothetical protein